MAVNCAILSYNGTVYFGFSGDTHAAPDLRRFEKLLQECFVELQDAVGLRPTEKKKAIKERQVSPPVAAGKDATSPAPVPITSLESLQSPRIAEPAPPTQLGKALTQSIVA